MEREGQAGGRAQGGEQVNVNERTVREVSAHILGRSLNSVKEPIHTLRTLSSLHMERGGADTSQDNVFYSSAPVKQLGHLTE